jgi:hypothetical protein
MNSYHISKYFVKFERKKIKNKISEIWDITEKIQREKEEEIRKLREELEKERNLRQKLEASDANSILNAIFFSFHSVITKLIVIF